mgnify:CR=1 FL=1
MDESFQSRQVTGTSPSNENNSGGGALIDIPAGVKGFSWGALIWSWLWSIFNGTWIGLLALVPYVGFGVAIYLGFKGREMAWRNKRWDSLEHFNRVQRSWTRWGLVVPGIALIGIIVAIVLPALQHRNVV